MKTNTSVIVGKMTQIWKASDLVKAVPLPELRKWGTGEGEIVDPFDLSFAWKVKGEDTGFMFAVYEMTIKPEAKIPIHIHPYAEFFYVLEGQVDVMGIDAGGALTWTPVSAGECANAPANAPHGIKNRSAQSAKFLSVSNFEHEKPFNDYQALVKTPEGQSMSEGEKADAIMEIADLEAARPTECAVGGSRFGSSLEGKSRRDSIVSACRKVRLLRRAQGCSRQAGSRQK
jgi:quercetin dioxygenase-like cupin family protein